MTKEDWKKAEERLFGSFSGVDLMVDGYRVGLRLTRLKMKLVILPYINGDYKAEWQLNDCEERRRFFRPVTASAWTAKGKRAMKKIPKSHLKKMGIDPDQKNTYYSWAWPSFGPLRRHLEKNNKSISLVEP